MAERSAGKAKYRVLHPITKMVIGGAQENTLLTAELLDKDLFEPTIVCGPGDHDSEGELLSRAREGGIPVVEIAELVREINPVKDTIALAKLLAMMRRGRFDIVHTHGSKAGVLGRVAGRLARVPIIIHTAHGWNFHDSMSGFYRRCVIECERMLADLTDRMIVVAERDLDKGLQAGIAERSKYTTIRSGFELERFRVASGARAAVRGQLGVGDDTCVVGMVGRLSEQKAPLEFVRMAEIVARKIANARFFLVGDGPLRGQVEQSIRERGLDEKVILLGTRNDVPELMSAFDVVVLTSRWEGLPRVVPEAMVCGRPVVAMAVDGVTEIIEDGVTGHLVPPGETARLADAVASVLADNARATAMAARARELTPEFCATKMVKEIEELYLELIAEKRVEGHRAALR